MEAQPGLTSKPTLLCKVSLLPQVLSVEDIPTQRLGAVAACVAPLFSHRPDIHQWMDHYTQLGVNRFHM